MEDQTAARNAMKSSPRKTAQHDAKRALIMTDSLVTPVASAGA